jgi:hypothetical protein
MRLRPDVIAIQQPVELLHSQLHDFLLQQSWPVIFLMAFNFLPPQGEVVFIKPLFRMSLIDRENTVLSLLSRGASAWRAPSR